MKNNENGTIKYNLFREAQEDMKMAKMIHGARWVKKGLWRLSLSRLLSLSIPYKALPCCVTDFIKEGFLNSFFPETIVNCCLPGMFITQFSASSDTLHIYPRFWKVFCVHLRLYKPISLPPGVFSLTQETRKATTCLKSYVILYGKPKFQYRHHKRQYSNVLCNFRLFRVY